MLNKLHFLKSDHKYIGNINRCAACNLAMGSLFTPCRSEGQGQTVFFIAESPTTAEDKRKTAFVSRPNMFLKGIIDKNNLLEDSYFTQLVRCRPFLNPRPTESEIETCKTHLIRELQHYKPLIIVTLGLTVYNHVIGDNEEYISHVVNKPIAIDRYITPMNIDHIAGNKTIIIPIHSPSYIIKSGKYEEYDESFKVINDFYRVLINKFHI